MHLKTTFKIKVSTLNNLLVQVYWIQPNMKNMYGIVNE